MKILYVTSDANWGGSSVALYNLISCIKQSNEISVLMPNMEGRLYNELNKIGVKCFAQRFYNTTYPPDNGILNKLKYPYRLLKMLFLQHRVKMKVENLIIQIKPDIVHCNVGPLDITLDACKKYNIPHIWHLREYQKIDLGLNVFPSEKYFRKRILSKGNYNIAITKGIFDFWHLRNCDVQIYDGVFDEKEFSEDYTWPQKEKYFLYVGSIFRGKNLLCAIQAFSSFIKKHSEYKLLIAGNPNTNPDYTIQCVDYINKNHINDSVEFMGQRNDVYALMQKATALIVPSQFEAFGFITAEAMFNKCLVIGRNTAGTKEQFDNILNIVGRDLCLRFDSEISLINRMEEALKYPVANLGIARNTVIGLYGIEIHAHKIMSFYDKCRNRK